MKKLFICAVLALVFTSCGIGNLPEQPPETVTNPRMVGTYQKALGGDVESLRRVSECYRKGMEGFPRDRSMVLSCTKMMAERGDLVSQRELGRAYLHGIGVSQSDSQAQRWLSLAAEQGDAQAERSLKLLNIKVHNEGVRRRNVERINEQGTADAHRILNTRQTEVIYVTPAY